jgi:ribosomal protein L7/L12
VQTTLRRAAELILGDRFPAFEALLTTQADGDDTSEAQSVLLLEFARREGLVVSVDWSGEEEPGDFERGVTAILQRRGWLTPAWEGPRSGLLEERTDWERGDYIVALMAAVNVALSRMGLALAQYDTGWDEYHLTVLRAADMGKVIGLRGDGFRLIDVCRYQVHLTDAGPQRGRVILAVKRHLGVGVIQARDALATLPLAVGEGTHTEAHEISDSLRALGAATTVSPIG